MTAKRKTKYLQTECKRLFTYKRIVNDGAKPPKWTSASRTQQCIREEIWWKNNCQKIPASIK